MSLKSSSSELVQFIVKFSISCIPVKFNCKESVLTLLINGSLSTISKFFNWDFQNAKSSNILTSKSYQSLNIKTTWNLYNG